ncbi:hypothetical protein PFICI_06575 [Pestalotiopsis fici W106-1]|uniref:Methyltransferase type 11 domain-containing protein n=1 Tax=Pestalotiopsis fici (strain W106-1 / CGMCC3.15140) TaxID=1229662 RepID=W3X620_PESFW|nr:uncharacterized protein PFICI_06575 [Pestalotiopsis fici W106-1]ETS81573.1 hypothetical protein PFICI_06575 [Pestalotiopsis fici W106-1]
METFKEIFAEVTGPLLFMSVSLSYAPKTIFEIIKSGDFWRLWSLDGFKEALFGNFWAVMGPEVKANGQERVIPLLEGRISGGRVHDRPVASPIHGTVIEVGAGSGMWMDVLGRFVAGAASSTKSAAQITRIYGVEPNPKSAAALRQRVQALGLEDTYEVVPVGIESLNRPGVWAGHVAPESVDCIVGVLCLCSIPDPEENIKHLYKLLKPGGHWYVYEHVKASRGGFWHSLYQRESLILRQIQPRC